MTAKKAIWNQNSGTIFTRINNDATLSQNIKYNELGMNALFFKDKN